MFSKISLILLLGALSSQAFAMTDQCRKEAFAANSAILQINQEEPNLTPEAGLIIKKDLKAGTETYTVHNYVSDGYRFTDIVTHIEEVDGVAKCLVLQVVY
jgi:hypothetical protein